MHGWASNDHEIIENVCEESKLGNENRANFCNAEERVLGLYWDQTVDSFSFNVGFNKIKAEIINGNARPTKREVLARPCLFTTPSAF